MRNFISSLTTYGELSPNLEARNQVNRWLKSRPCLARDDWFRQCWKSYSVPKPLIDFVYDRLGAYSGLDVGRLRPTDRLLEELQWPAVCWFDWGMTLCEDFSTTFGVDLSTQFDETQLATCADLVLFLNRHLGRS